MLGHSEWEGVARRESIFGEKMSRQRIFLKAKKRGKEEESSCKERREKTDPRPSYVPCTKLESPVFPRKGMKRNRLFFPLTTHFPPAHLTKSVDFSLFFASFFAGDRVSMRVRMLLGFGCGFKGMLFKTDEDGVKEKKRFLSRFLTR